MSALAPSAQAYQAGMTALAEGRHAEAIAALEVALAGNPADPATLFALGEAALQLGLHSAAVRFFHETLTHAPERHEATVQLSLALAMQLRHGDAIDVLRDALSRAPETAALWVALGNVVRETGDTDNASTFYSEALRLNPGSVEARGNLADLVFDAGDVTEALALYDQAVRQAPENAQLRVNRALALLSKGDVEAGWRDYEWRLRLPAKAIERRQAPKLWDGSPRHGRPLLVMSEQGVGDQIAFASFLPQMLDDGPIVLECEPRLRALLARSLPGVAVHGAMIRREGAHLSSTYDWLEGGDEMVAVNLASLPHFCGGKPRDPQPWLTPDAAEARAWSQWRVSLGPQPVIGISWRSGLKGGLRDSQYAPLDRWAQFLARMPHVLPVVAQYSATEEEILALEALSGRTLIVPPGLDQKAEIDRTAAMLSVLDAVVTAPTAVASMSGALGVPTFKILHYRSWTAMGAEREPFMPAARCMTPSKAGLWREVFEKTLSQLSVG